MSADVIRKGGRPKKSTRAPSEKDIVEPSPPGKTTARKRSTKSAAATEKPSPSSSKPSLSKATTSKPPAKPAAAVVPPERGTVPASKQPVRPSPSPAHAQKPAPNPTPVTPATSTILKAVADKGSPATEQSTEKRNGLLKSARVERPSSIPPQTAQSAPSKPHVSPASVNAYVVSQLSSRPSRPAPKISDGKLPEKYKPAARRITYVMVALPIAIVTSYVLYQRLILGQERKQLIREPEEPRLAEES